jgi:hypothetical protein
LQPISRDAALAAVRKMMQFHEETARLFERYGMSLTADLGRRNTLLSAAQEKFFSDELSAHFRVSTDGRAGQPDIRIRDPETGETRELECKLTTRNRSGGINLQTDYDTLRRKGCLDYLYVIASPEFTEFCVMHFSGLTPDDFRTPAPGSRGKSGMIKHRCFAKATTLVGEYTSLRDQSLARVSAALAGSPPPARRRRLEGALQYWTAASDRYTIRLEKVSASCILNPCDTTQRETGTWNLTGTG